MERVVVLVDEDNIKVTYEPLPNRLPRDRKWAVWGEDGQLLDVIPHAEFVMLVSKFIG